MTSALEQAARFAAFDATAAGATEPELRRALDTDTDARVRSAALGALCRLGRADAWSRATGDAHPSVRRRAAELAPSLGPVAEAGLLSLLTDPDVLVVEAASWACGEIAWPPRARPGVVLHLTTVATHRDPLVREAAVAALGAIGDPAGLPTILAGCTDRPAVRRRAVLALAPFAGPEVDAALAAAATDHDWQVRQAVEDLTSERPVNEDDA